MCHKPSDIPGYCCANGCPKVIAQRSPGQSVPRYIISAMFCCPIQITDSKPRRELHSSVRYKRTQISVTQLSHYVVRSSETVLLEIPVECVIASRLRLQHAVAGDFPRHVDETRPATSCLSPLVSVFILSFDVLCMCIPTHDMIEPSLSLFSIACEVTKNGGRTSVSPASFEISAYQVPARNAA
jgi:hypothetical protein